MEGAREKMNERWEQLGNEWDTEKNRPLHFENVTQGSDRKVWWKCSKGHSWAAKVCNRFRGSGCPVCAGRVVIPGENDLRTLYPAIADEWHPTKNGDRKPSEMAPHSNQYAWWLCASGHAWRTKINNRTSNGCGCPYCQGLVPIPGENDLETTFPEVAKEWHDTKNGSLKPRDVFPQSNRQVWWRCEEGHEWQTKVCHRVDGTGCPYCSGQRAIPGENDLETLRPDITKQWHPTKNGKKKPKEYTVQSHARVWWQCDLGHEWQSTIGNRLKCGCPVCGNRKVLPGVNDLQTLAPRLAMEWCQEKNESVRPEQVMLHSNKRYFWQCEKGHIWRTTPNNRANGTNCPYCNQHRLIPEETSLAVVNPMLAKEWNVTRNDGKTAMEVPAYCNDIYWWQCEYGHEWQTTVSNRSKGDGCPYCSGRLAIPGETDFATLYPEFAAQWNKEKNGSKRPEQFRPGSNEKVWWHCPQCRNNWEATIVSRVDGCGCPYCSGNRAISGENDLATLYPKIAAQWDLEKNGEKEPNQFLPVSSYKAWWRCERGHNWKAAIASRTAGTGCPYCAQQIQYRRKLI